MRVRGVLGSGGPPTKQTWVRNPRSKGADRSVGSMSVEVQCALLTLAFLRRSPPWLPINSNFLPESMAVKVNRFNGDQHIARRVTTCFRRGISSTRSVGSQPSMSKPLNIGHRIGDTRPSSSVQQSHSDTLGQIPQKQLHLNLDHLQDQDKLRKYMKGRPRERKYNRNGATLRYAMRDRERVSEHVRC